MVGIEQKDLLEAVTGALRAVIQKLAEADPSKVSWTTAHISFRNISVPCINKKLVQVLDKEPVIMYRRGSSWYMKTAMYVRPCMWEKMCKRGGQNNKNCSQREKIKVSLKQECSS